MALLEWDAIGKKYYETGVDRGVLYVAAAGAYPTGVAWNGLVNVTESPTGAESNPQYADNIKYLNLTGAEEFEGTIEAFTYPPEFEACDGSASPIPGVMVGQQARKSFGLCYRTKLGNDVDGIDHGYKLHLVYGCQAAPSEKAYGTVNDSPEAITFSWEFTTTPVPVSFGGVALKPTSILTIDSTKVNKQSLAALEAKLYGDTTSEASLPLPTEVLTMMNASGFSGGAGIEMAAFEEVTEQQ